MSDTNDSSLSLDESGSADHVPPEGLYSEIRIWESPGSWYDPYEYSSWPPGYRKIAGGLYPHTVFTKDFPPPLPGQDPPFGIGFLRRLIAASSNNVPKASADGQEHNTEK